MLLFSPAKINIGLYVSSKRNDAYHNISSLFFPLKFSDILEYIPDVHGELSGDLLSISGQEIPGDKADNLILDACRRIREVSELPFFKIHLHKIIPIGAGLGGGSSNGAYMLKALQAYTIPF